MWETARAEMFAMPAQRNQLGTKSTRLSAVEGSCEIVRKMDFFWGGENVFGLTVSNYDILQNSRQSFSFMYVEYEVLQNELV
jgi:hypothetical protein